MPKNTYKITAKKYIKSGIFTIGIDDAPHKRDKNKNILTKRVNLIFTYCRGVFLEKVFMADIDVDGLDATRVVIDVLKRIKESKTEFSYVLTHGITCGGFNMFDIEEIHKVINVPIIAITENNPHNIVFKGEDNGSLRSYNEKADFKGTSAIDTVATFNKKSEFYQAIIKLNNSKERIRVLKNAGKMYETAVEISKNPVYFYVKGTSVENARDLIRKLAFRSKLPEPINLAHKIASAFSSIGK